MIGLSHIDHIGIAVEDLEQAIQIYSILTGAAPQHRELIIAEGVETAFFKVGESNLELLQATDPESPIAKFIQKQGRGGIHHVCVSVQDIEAKLLELKDSGMQLIDATPRRGAHGKRVAFVHPKALGGVLLELSEDVTS